MINVRGVASRTLNVSVARGDDIRRRNELLDVTNPVKRAASVIIHDAVLRFPLLSARLVGFDTVAAQSLEYVGMGTDATVFKNSAGTAIKLHEKTRGMPVTEQLAFAAKRQDNHDKMASYLGDIVVPQRTLVDTHPFFPAETIVQTIQPFQFATAADIFLPQTEVPNYGTVREIIRKPAQASTLEFLIQNSLNLYADEDLIPDIKGRGNLVFTNALQDLRLLDGHPATVDQPDDQQFILRQIHNLADCMAV